MIKHLLRINFTMACKFARAKGKYGSLRFRGHKAGVIIESEHHNFVFQKFLQAR